MSRGGPVGWAAAWLPLVRYEPLTKTTSTQ